MTLMSPSERLFRLFLYCYPAELRREFGVEMSNAFRDELRSRRRGFGAIPGLWLWAIGDLSRTARAARRDRRARLRQAGAAGPDGSHDHRPAPRGGLMEALLNDVRHGIRVLLKNPGFAAAAILTLAVGVGASVTMFSGLSNFVLDPLPFEDQNELYAVWSVMTSRGVTDNVSYPDYLDWQESEAFEATAASYPRGYNLAGGDEASRVDAMHVSPSLFPLLGAEAAHGRIFTPEEGDPGHNVAILNYGLWQRLFGADPNVVGSTIRLDGQPYTVVGVMPEGFFYPGPADEIWLPLGLPRESMPRDSRFLMVVGRTADGVTREEAQSSMRPIAARLEEEYPGTNSGYGAIYLSPLLSEIVWDEMRWAMYMLATTGLLVMLIACVNVANLLVAKGLSRRRELAVRAALGAGRFRLVRQHLAENVVLGLTGGALGLAIAGLGISGIGEMLAANEPGRVPRLQEYLESGVDARVLVFTLLITVGAVLLFGLLPAWQNTCSGLYGSLQGGDRGMGAGARSRRLQKSLVVFEVALTLTLLVAAGLTFRSYAVVMDTDPGMDRSNLLTMMVSPTEAQYPEERQVRAFYNEALDAFRALPGAQSASVTSSLPAARQGSFRGFEIEGRAVVETTDRPRANRVIVGTEYFETMKVGLVRGRFLSAADGEDTPRVLVINQTLARLYWPDEDPVGQRIRPVTGQPEPWVEIVGVVGDIKNNGLHRPTWPAVYLPMTQLSARQMNFVIRTASEPLATVAAVRGAIGEIDDSLPIFRVMSMQQVFDNRFWGETLTMKLFVWCALGALVLAIVGIYGVISYSVSQRTHEMGVRIALGAKAGNVVSLVVRQGLVLALIGIVFGLLMGFGLSRGMSFLLFGVDANDPVTYASVVVLVAAIATLASWVPARRATRVDPIITLRSE